MPSLTRLGPRAPPRDSRFPPKQSLLGIAGDGSPCYKRRKVKANQPPQSRPTPVPAPRPEREGNPATARGRGIELLTAGVLTLWITVLHLVCLFHAGPLWRDEVGSVDFAAMSSWGEIWRNLRYDNFPPLFVAVARLWTRAGLNSDFDYRLLGFLIGIGTLAMLWWCARKLGGRAPLLVLALYAANPLAIRTGDAVRPYGLGIALALLTAALVWDFVQAPGRRRLFRATLAATLSVQCLYQNAFFIVAFCCGAWVVALGRREWKTARQTGMIGLVAALSLLPYWGILRAGREWADVAMVENHVGGIWQVLLGAMREAGGWMAPVWLVLCAAGLAVLVFYGMPRRRRLMVYGGTVLAVSAMLQILFLWKLNMALTFWYFLLLMAVAALMLDAISSELDGWRPLLGRAVLSCVVVAANLPASYSGVCWRRSNIDLIAATLKQAAQPGDVILVCPFIFGITLQRYLDTNRWTTVEPMEDLRIHRYDLEKKAMMANNPIGPALDKVRGALRSGHSVWLVVDKVFVPPADAGPPPPLLPPYTGNMDWAALKYEYNWTSQVIYLMKQHGTTGSRVNIPVPGGQSLDPAENITVLVASGWRE